MIDLKAVRTIEEALWAIIATSSSDMIEDWKNIDEDSMWEYHHGFGTWVRNKFGLWEGGRLKAVFNLKGIHHADDMSGIILTTLHRRLHGKEIKLEEQVKHYRDFWTNSGINPDTMQKLTKETSNGTETEIQDEH
jgi:hypothetical protein